MNLFRLIADKPPRFNLNLTGCTPLTYDKARQLKARLQKKNIYTNIRIIPRSPVPEPVEGPTSDL